MKRNEKATYSWRSWWLEQAALRQNNEPSRLANDCRGVWAVFFAFVVACLIAYSNVGLSGASLARALIMRAWSEWFSQTQPVSSQASHICVSSSVGSLDGAGPKDVGNCPKGGLESGPP